MRGHVVVVGAGIIGASIAYYLTRLGIAVTVVEKGVPAAGATSHSFGWINANTPDDADYFRLRLASLLEYRVLEAGLHQPLPLRWGGSLNWQGEWEMLAREATTLRGFGYPVEVLCRAEIMAMEPALADVPAFCHHAPLEGALNPALAATMLLAAARENGARLILGAEVTAFATMNGRMSGVRTSAGTVGAERIVLATGVRTQALLADIGMDLPMDNRPGVILRTRPVAPILNHIVLAPGLHVRQEVDGTLLAGEDFVGGEGTDDPTGAAAEVLVRLQRLLPGVAGLEVGQVTAGTRPIPADGLPAIGWLDTEETLYVATMHSGVTLAPIVGRLASLEIAGRPAEEMLAGYRPVRLARAKGSGKSA